VRSGGRLGVRSIGDLFETGRSPAELARRPEEDCAQHLDLLSRWAGGQPHRQQCLEETNASMPRKANVPDRSKD